MKTVIGLSILQNLLFPYFAIYLLTKLTSFTATITEEHNKL